MLSEDSFNCSRNSTVWVNHKSKGYTGVKRWSKKNKQTTKNVNNFIQDVLSLLSLKSFE